MPERLGDTFKNTSMVTPLNASPGKADPGPPILNNPLMEAADPTGYLNDPTKPGTRKAIKGKASTGPATGS